MRDTERPLTEDERALLEPLIDATEIPVCVTAVPTVFSRLTSVHERSQAKRSGVASA